MEFEEQIENAMLEHKHKKVYLMWTNIEIGRDKKSCYERIEVGGTIIYLNCYNRDSAIFLGNPFFAKLENLYMSLLEKTPNDNQPIFSTNYLEWVKQANLNPLTNTQHNFAEWLLEEDNMKEICKIADLETIFISIRKWLK